MIKKYNDNNNNKTIGHWYKRLSGAPLIFYPSQLSRESEKKKYKKMKIE